VRSSDSPVLLTQTRGSSWQHGEMRDLGTMGGPDTWAVFVNDRGQGDQFVHAFLWNGEKLSDLGTLGGNYSFTRGINDAGEVTGPAWVPGDQVKHGFLWKNGVMTDLGTLGGDPCSDALSVGSRGQVVGASQSAAGGCDEWTTAFLSENGGPSVVSPLTS
jgi:probable HAF family extracellular repeat protein